MASKLFNKIEERLHVVANVYAWTGGHRSLRNQYLMVAAETLGVYADTRAEPEAKELRALAGEIVNRAIN